MGSGAVPREASLPSHRRDVRPKGEKRRHCPPKAPEERWRMGASVGKESVLEGWGGGSWERDEGARWGAAAEVRARGGESRRGRVQRSRTAPLVWTARSSAPRAHSRVRSNIFLGRKKPKPLSSCSPRSGLGSCSRRRSNRGWSSPAPFPP